MKKLLLAVVFAAVASGCATFRDNQPAARLAVTYATLKVIEGGDDQVARAQKILDIANDAKHFLDGDAVTLSALEQAVRDRLAAEELSPADRLLADALVLTIAAELRERIGQGALGAEQRVTVSTVLDWVTQAAGG